MKKTFKHAIAIALIVGFAVFALGSMGSSPSSGSSYSGGGSYSGSGGCPNGSCHVFADADGNGSYDVCSRSSCAAYNTPYPVPANTNVKCNCR